MNNLEDLLSKKKTIWISTTGYRILYVLRLLMLKERTLDELVSLLKADEIVKKSVSKDTVRVTINTLRKGGCDIPRPAKSNGYKYKLVSHPFIFNMSDEEVNALLKFRTILCDSYNWEKILLINDLYDKIFSLTQNQKQIEEVKGSELLANIDKKLLAELSNPAIINKKIQLTYNSVKYSHENLDVVPKKLIYQNGKLYLLCFNFKYQENSILNVERIEKINSINLFETYDKECTYEVKYRIYNDSVNSFELKDGEEIIERDKNSITVKANVLNEFLFIQRILLFATDCEIISPVMFKEKIINKLKLIKRGYENE